MGRTKRSLHVVSTRSLRDEAPTTEQEQNSFSVDMEASSSSVRKRGRAKCGEIQRLEPGLTAPLVFNNHSQPISANAEKFGSYLGMLARRLVPINIKSWIEVKDDVREEILKHVEAKFSYDISREKFKRHVYSKLVYFSRTHRCELRKKLDLDLSLAENYKMKPNDVDIQQWQDFVQFNFSEEGWARSTQGKRSRSCQVLNHNTGRTSFAKVSHVERDEHGKELRPLEFFQRTHRAKKGVNVEAAKVLEIATQKLQYKIGETSDPSQNDLYVLEQEVLDEMLGPQHSGRVRGFGFGPTKSSIRRSQMENSEIAELKKEMKRVIEERDERIKQAVEESLEENREENRQEMRRMQEELQMLRRYVLSSQANGSGRTEQPQASCS